MAPGLSTLPFITAYDRLSMPDNMLDRISFTELNVVHALQESQPFADPSEVFADVVYRGDLYTGDGTPADSTYSGVFVAQQPFQFGGYAFNVGGVLNGGIQFGLSAVDGSALFAGGAGVINASGMTMTGLYFPINFTSTFGGLLRNARTGMTLLPGGSTPVFQIGYSATLGTNLITNGDAETGDLTGWTDAQGAWSASTTNPSSGTYSFRHDPTNSGFPAFLTQTVTGLSAAVNYTFQFDSRRAFGYLTPTIILIWQTSGHAVIRTDYISGNIGTSWNTINQTFLSPATTAECVVELTLSNVGNDDPFQEVYFDNIIFATASVSTQLEATDAGWQFEAPLLYNQQTSTPNAPASPYIITYQYSDGALHSLNSNSEDQKIADPNYYGYFYTNQSDFGSVTGGGSGTIISGPFTYQIVTGGGSGSVAAVGGISNHPGNVKLSAGGGGVVTVGNLDNTTMFAGYGGEVAEGIFDPNSVSAATTITFGFFDATNQTYTNAIHINIANTTLTGKVVDGGSTSTTGTSYTITAATWYRWKIVINAAGTQADFYVYASPGTSALWHDTLAIATNHNTSFGASVKKTGAGSVDVLYIDWMAFGYLGKKVNR